jgi:hypothetical protein
MKHRTNQIVMVICQLGIFVAAIMLSSGADGGAVLCGILMAATVTPTILVLMEQPQDLLRWNMAALYPLAFATMVRLTSGQPEAEAEGPVVMAVVMGVYGCVLVACGVVTMHWRRRPTGTVPWISADTVTRLASNQSTPRANERGARVLRGFISGILGDLAIGLIRFLVHCIF